MQLNKKIISFFQISRPVNFVITFLVVVVACIISVEESYSTVKIILAGLSAALTASAGNVINDYFDVNIDKINKPKRVLPSGKLSLKEAFTYYAVLSISALIISSFININAFIIVFIASLFLFFYSYRLKKISLVGNISVSTLTALAFIYGGVVVNNIGNAIIPAAFAFLINMIREIVKDMEDVEGDKNQNANTYPVSFGIKKSKIIVVIVTVLLIILTLYPFVFNIYSIEYSLIIMVFVNPMLIYMLKSLYENESVKNLNRLSNLLKLNMVIGLIAIFVGR